MMHCEYVLLLHSKVYSVREQLVQDFGKEKSRSKNKEAGTVGEL